MKMGNLQNRGVSHIEDKAITFYNGQLIDQSIANKDIGSSGANSSSL